MATKLHPKKKPAPKAAAPKKSPPKKPMSTKKPVEASVKSTASTSPAAQKGKKVPELVRGMKDITPREGRYWLEMYHVAEKIAEAYNFHYIETPIVEEASLFVRTIGRGTDVIDKEMYVFDDRDGSKLALRPEATASVARSYIAHGMHTLPQPVKMWYSGPMFRHDRPQAGRYRQFHQFGCETIGEHDPAIDAELVVTGYNFLRDLGIDTQVHINSIGTPEDRERYLVELLGYLRSKRAFLSEESKKRMTKNPLRILDSKEEEDRLVIEEAPQILDWLSEHSKQYFMKVLEYLDDMEVPYVLTPRLVRGLDYYTDTVFEFYKVEEDTTKSQSALGGGGRYNLLIQELGGHQTPAAGFALGLERVLHAMKKDEHIGDNALEKKSPIFFAHLGEPARRRTLYLIEQLRREGLILYHNISKPSLKSQLELANKHGASHALILGQKELQDGTIIIRDMASGIQEIVDQKKIGREIRKIMGLPV